MPAAEQILIPTDLKYVLLDNLKVYTDSVFFLNGSNPYRFELNGDEFFILMKNTHDSGHGRTNDDECRIQVSKGTNLALLNNDPRCVFIFGYSSEFKVFTAWDPTLMQPRLGKRKTVSLYTRFSMLKKAKENGFSIYVDNNGQNILNFVPEFLGVYLGNASRIHNLTQAQLSSLMEQYQQTETDDSTVQKTISNDIQLDRQRGQRDPKFRKEILRAYGNRCAMCGINLDLLEAAHIVPHAHPKGTDEVTNGVCLCSLHHTAYDTGLVYFDHKYKVIFNSERLHYLERIGFEHGYRKIDEMTFPSLSVPKPLNLKPTANNISLANKVRAIPVTT